MKELILIILGIAVSIAGLTFSLLLGVVFIRIAMYLIDKLEDEK